MMNSADLCLEFQDELFADGLGADTKNAAHRCDLGDAALKDFDSCFDASDGQWLDFMASGDLWALVNHGKLNATEERETNLQHTVADEFGSVAAASTDLDDLKSKLPALRESLRGTLEMAKAEYEAEEPDIAARLLEMARAATGPA